MPKRPSIATSSAFATIAPAAPQPEAAPAPAATTSATKDIPAPANTPRNPRELDTTSVSVGIKPTTLDEARRAYWTEHKAGTTTAVNLDDWISDALRTHSRLSHATRTKRINALNTTHPEVKEPGKPRRFRLDSAAVVAANNTLDADHEAGHDTPSTSRYIVDAIRLATARTKEHHTTLLALPRGGLPRGGLGRSKR